MCFTKSVAKRVKGRELVSGFADLVCEVCQRVRFQKLCDKERFCV